MMTGIEAREDACKQTALTLSELGLPFVLCHGRNPIKLDPLRMYTSEYIECEFDNNPDLNVALILGRASGVMEMIVEHNAAAEREFDELMDGASVDTPTFTSSVGWHRLFQRDGRLAALNIPVMMHESVLVVVGFGITCLSMQPPSIVNGEKYSWLRSYDDCGRRIQRLPDHVVDTFIADYHGIKSQDCVPAPSNV